MKGERFNLQGRWFSEEATPSDEGRFESGSYLTSSKCCTGIIKAPALKVYRARCLRSLLSVALDSQLLRLVLMYLSS